MVVRYQKDVGIAANVIGNKLNYDIGLSGQAAGCSEAAGSELFRIGEKYGALALCCIKKIRILQVGSRKIRPAFSDTNRSAKILQIPQICRGPTPPDLRHLLLIRR